MSNPQVNILTQDLPVTIALSIGSAAKAWLIGGHGESICTFDLVEGTHQIPLPALPTGDYSLRIDTGKNLIVKQFHIS